MKTRALCIVLIAATVGGVMAYAAQQNSYLAATCRGGDYDEQANRDSIYEILKRKGKEVNMVAIEMKVLGYVGHDTHYAFRVGDISGEAVGDKCGANELLDLSFETCVYQGVRMDDASCLEHRYPPRFAVE